MAELAQIGVTGLAVMGRNLARNFARHGHRVAIHNRSYADRVLGGRGRVGGHVSSGNDAGRVRGIPGEAARTDHGEGGTRYGRGDQRADPLLEEGDIVIDAGNAHFPDTIRREAELKSHGLHFVGRRFRR